MLNRVAGCLLVAGLMVAGCGGPEVDIATVLAVSDVETGDLDLGIQDDGQNMLVPFVGFSVRNDAEVPVGNVQLNAVFRLIGESEEWGSSYLRAISGESLDPGASDTFMLRSNLGYTSTEPRAVMLTHSQFRDVHVQVFAKHGSAQWALIGEWDVDRTMLTE